MNGKYEDDVMYGRCGFGRVSKGGMTDVSDKYEDDVVCGRCGHGRVNKERVTDVNLYYYV